MARFADDGDIITTTHDKAGAMRMSVPLIDYRVSGDPAKLWETQPAVRTVAGAIARNVASVPLHLYQRVSDTDRKRVTDGPIAKLLGEPSTRVGQARYLEQIILDLAVHDRWAVLIGANDDGDLELTRLPAHRVAVTMNKGRRVGVTYFGGGKDGKTTLIPLDRVMFDVAPSATPQGTHDRGSARALTLAGMADELDDAGAWRRQVLQNGARIPAVIERPVDAPKWSDTSFDRFKAGIDQYRAGGGAEGGMPILEDGMKLHTADVFNPRDFDTNDLRQMTLLEACIVFHYPPELIGARPGNYSNVAAFREALYVDTLGPWISDLEQAWNLGLRPFMNDGDYIEANLAAKLRGDFETRAKILSTATGRSWLTTNEARARENLPRIEGGDELVTPLNVVVGGLASPRDTAPD